MFSFSGRCRWRWGCFGPHENASSHPRMPLEDVYAQSCFYFFFKTLDNIIDLSNHLHIDDLAAALCKWGGFSWEERKFSWFFRFSSLVTFFCFLLPLNLALVLLEWLSDWQHSNGSSLWGKNRPTHIHELRGSQFSLHSIPSIERKSVKSY